MNSIDRPSTLERRMYSGAPAFTLDERGAQAGRHLCGYAVVWDSLSQDLGGFRERIMRGAFAESLRDRERDVLALADHDTAKVLGRQSNNTLVLTEDGTGLLADIFLAETSYALDVAENVRAGNVKGMSFAFCVRPGGEQWTQQDGENIRTLTALDLYEVSTTPMPAYLDTVLALRRMAAALRPLSDAEREGNMARLRHAEATMALIKRQHAANSYH